MEQANAISLLVLLVGAAVVAAFVVRLDWHGLTGDAPGAPPWNRRS